jgi:positive regulator of sigma E activity
MKQTNKQTNKPIIHSRSTDSTCSCKYMCIITLNIRIKIGAPQRIYVMACESNMRSGDQMDMEIRRKGTWAMS